MKENFEEKPKVNLEMLKELRQFFAQEFEDYITDPRTLSVDSQKEILRKIREGDKLKGRTSYLMDMLIATASKKFKIWREEDFEKIKNEFFE